MTFWKLILVFLLIINSTSFFIESFFEKNKQDSEKCNNAGPIGSATIEKCTAATSTLNGPDSHNSKCCLFSFKIDPFKKLKQMFGTNWKKQFMKLYNLKNEIQLKLKLNQLKGLAGEKTKCLYYNKNYKNIILYGLAKVTETDEKIKYNCGDGEEIFDKEKYNPSNEEEKMDIDNFECVSEYSENNCINKGSKLLSDNSQCCWCEENTIFVEGIPNGRLNQKKCYGYPIKEFRSKLEEVLKNKKEGKYSMKCTCTNKKGTKITANVDSVNGKIEINN